MVLFLWFLKKILSHMHTLKHAVVITYRLNLSTHTETSPHSCSHNETRHCYPGNTPQCMSARLSAFLVSDPSILHASSSMTYCLACLCLHACECVCVSGGSRTASCTINMPRESLASQDREDREGPWPTSFHANASMLTRAVHACLCVWKRQ